MKISAAGSTAAVAAAAITAAITAATAVIGLAVVAAFRIWSIGMCNIRARDARTIFCHVDARSATDEQRNEANDEQDRRCHHLYERARLPDRKIYRYHAGIILPARNQHGPWCGKELT